MKPSEILEESKQYIWRGVLGKGGNGVLEKGNTTRYICVAVRHLGLMHGALESTNYTIVLNHIQDSLDGHPVLENWLNKVHLITYTEMNHQSRVQATRLAWMDDMIAYFKSKGQ